MAVWQCECGHKTTTEKGLTVHENRCATSLMHQDQTISVAQQALRQQDGPSKRRRVGPGPRSPPKFDEPGGSDTGSHTGIPLVDPSPSEKTDESPSAGCTSGCPEGQELNEAVIDQPGEDRGLPPLLPKRQRRLPKRYRDLLPAPPAPLPPEPVREACLPRVLLHVWERFCTPRNIFGLWREYLGHPSYVPDLALHEDEWAPGVAALSDTQPQPAADGHGTTFWPFPNISQFLLGNWFVNSPSGERSGRDLDSLVHVIQDPRFDPTELAHFSHRNSMVRMAGNRIVL
ncbi:hypothetical protein JB92DRAFT_3102554 [Gautieria morchelliformis]|nr:hypothetical protein JB92DRAFT_3102554 [Gautieria morchelliformis]